MAIISRMTRSTMLENLDHDYVRTVRGKGVREITATRHARRNALIPILPVIGQQCGAVVGGAVLTETLFSCPDNGRLLVTAIQARDFKIGRVACGGRVWQSGEIVGVADT